MLTDNGGCGMGGRFLGRKGKWGMVDEDDDVDDDDDDDDDYEMSETKESNMVAGPRDANRCHT